jgi:uroporphyrinogen III methyltransferase/synthase
MFMGKLKVVSRDSPLARLQVKEVFSVFSGLDYQLLALPVLGDKQKRVLLTEDGVPPDFFTRELDALLLGGAADVAVHSAKDLPYPLPAGLELYALLEAFDKTDSLVAKNHRTLRELPEGARVGTSSATRRAEVLACRADVEIVGIRGTIGERLALVDSGEIDALVVASCALKRLRLADRISETLPFKTHPLQGHLAVVGRTGRPEISALFASKDVRRAYGKVALVGFGPGNPSFLTLAGDRLLRRATCIFHDDLIDRAYLERYPGKKIYAGKRKDGRRTAQDEINEMLFEAATHGEKVVRLKGGDPMIFAHGREEIDFLRSRFVEVEVVPGVSAGIAAAACTQIPLTHRGLASSVAFVAGHTGEEAQTPSADTLVYYMGGAQIAGIARALIAAGRPADTPAALVHHVSLPQQAVCFSTLGELQYSIFDSHPPVLLMAGKVVGLENGAVQRQKVLLTGTSPDVCPRPNAVHTPLIRIEKADDNRALHEVATNCAFDWIVFTSRYGVRYFFEALSECNADIRAFAGTRFASVGRTTTGELRKHLICPDYEAPGESSESLLNYFREKNVSGQHFLLPRSDKGATHLPRELERLGNRVTDIHVYRNTANEAAEKVDLSAFGKIIFFSPSGVAAFARMYGEMPRETLLVARGKTTAETLQSYLKI